jgi:hypothetical protein
MDIHGLGLWGGMAGLSALASEFYQANEGSGARGRRSGEFISQGCPFCKALPARGNVYVTLEIKPER